MGGESGCVERLLGRIFLVSLDDTFETPGFFGFSGPPHMVEACRRLLSHGFFFDGSASAVLFPATNVIERPHGGVSPFCVKLLILPDKTCES